MALSSCLVFVWMHILISTSYAEDNDSLCDCVSISTTSVSESFEKNAEILCYSYSIKYNLAMQACHTQRVDLLFASCTNDEQLSQSMHAIYLNEQSQSIASSVTNSGVQINNLMPSFNADLLTHPMQSLSFSIIMILLPVQIMHHCVDCRVLTRMKMWMWMWMWIQISFPRDNHCNKPFKLLL